jgi:Carboxypeptidase regulatory-like domain
MQRAILTLTYLLLMAISTVAQSTANPKVRNETNEETCVVSGIVTRKEDGAPLKSATVQLENSEDREHTIATKTTLDGHFELHKVPAGQYRIKVTRNGYAPQEFGQKRSGDPGAKFVLRPGQQRTDLIFKLSRAGVITGRIFDDDGEPMPGALVFALRQKYREGRREYTIEQETITNDLGEYRLFALSSGSYFVSSQVEMWNRVVGDREFSGTDKNSGEKGYTKFYYPSATDVSKATSIQVKEGEEIPSVDILMKEVPVYRVRGKIVNSISQKSAAQAQLEVARRNGKVEWDLASLQPSVKADGAFEIPELAPGEYTVIGYWIDEGKLYSVQEDFEIANADVEGLTLFVGTGVNIPGRIDWEGKPSLSGAEVTVNLEPLQGGFGWQGLGRVNDLQQFTIKEVPQGVFRLRVMGLSKDCYVKEVRQGETVLSDNTIRVKGAVSPIDITVSSRGAKVGGTVTNEESLPVPGVWVVAVPEAAERKRHERFASVNTDQYGHFELRGLAPGTYKLFSWDQVEPGAWEDEDFLKAYEDKGVTLQLVDGDAKAADLNSIQMKNAAANPE